jgi:hypothetical protein
MRTGLSFAGLVTALALQCASAADLVGLSFTHNDWQLVCDNTRTCRAAGYSTDGSDMSVSVLLTREAGPNQPVTGQLMIGEYGENPALKALPAEFKATMRVNQRSLGDIVIRKDSLVAELSDKQVAALLAALPRASDIAWQAGKHRWSLSDQGAAAVLLKMDEFQGRVGTRNALMRKGPRNDDQVLPPLPVPVVIAAPLANPLPGDEQLAGKRAAALRKALLPTVSAKADQGFCDDLEAEAPADGEPTFTIRRLTRSHLLVSTQCWRGAYNTGYGYWVVQDAPDLRPVLVTTSGSEDSDDTITASHKGRGIGDCLSSETWTWDGKRFVRTDASSTGLCRLLAAGGGWHLPEVVMTVRPH